MRAFVVVAAYTYQIEELADLINNISHIGVHIPPPPKHQAKQTPLRLLWMTENPCTYEVVFLGKGVGQFRETFKCKGSLCVT